VNVSLADPIFSRKSYLVTAGPHTLLLGTRTYIMGILNMTPDSFSGDGCLSSAKDATKKAVRLAQRFVREGADIIDVGGESSRPGAQKVSAKEEIRRVIPAIRALARAVKSPISIDTYKPLVARHALDQGASIVNNIMGTKMERSFLRMVRQYNAAIVLMHMRGTPRSMQRNIRYKNVVSEIIDSLKKSVENCLEIGVKSDKIIVDPGIGFAKTAGHNLEIIHHLGRFAVLHRPVLIGVSRKSFIGKVLGRDISGRLNGSLAGACASILNGAHMIRAHDVGPTKEVAVMTDAIMRER